jgi:2-methylcitrate dehydratase PrpD
VVAEREGAGGKDVIVSFILGTEFDCRVGIALHPRVLCEQGFHPSSIAGTIGVASAAGRLLGLSPRQHAASLGLSVQQTTGLLAWQEDTSENSRLFNRTIAARKGIASAHLALLGFGPPALVNPCSDYNTLGSRCSCGCSGQMDVEDDLGVDVE